MALAWNAESLWLQLEPWLPGLSIEVVPEAVSTNTTLLERARTADEDEADGGGIAQVRRSRESAAFGRRAVDIQPCLLVAEHQTGGRGRMGRRWASAPGASLTFSLSVPMNGPDWSGLSLAVGAALADAFEPAALSTPRIALKWPNDLWLRDGAHGGRKLGGILIESVSAGAGRIAVIGVGLNVLPRPADAPSDLAHGYACLQELDPAITAPAAFGLAAPAIVRAVLDFQRQGYGAFAARFDARDFLRGRAITTTLPDLPEGTAQGIAPGGALRVLTPAGAVREVASGEVSVRLQGPAC